MKAILVSGLPVSREEAVQYINEVCGEKCITDTDIDNAREMIHLRRFTGNVCRVSEYGRVDTAVNTVHLVNEEVWLIPLGNLYIFNSPDKKDLADCGYIGKRNFLREHKSMLDRLSVVYGTGEVVV